MEPNGRDVATNKFLKSVIFGDDLDLGSAVDLDEQPDLFAKKMHDGAVRAALAKTNDAHCAIDLPMPDQSGIDDEISSPFLKSPRIIHGVPSALKKTSGTKFIELLALVRKTFDGHPEEMSEVFEIVTKARDDARAEAIAIAAAQ